MTNIHVAKNYCIWQRHLCDGNSSLGCAMYRQFGVISGASTSGGSDTSLPAFLTVDQFFTASHHFIDMISDADQLRFFIRGFSRTGDQIEREKVQELVQSAYQVAHLHHPELCPQLTKAVVDAAMHNKESIGVNYLTKWCLQHCHRIVYWMHRHIANFISSANLSQSVPSNVSESSQDGSSTTKEILSLNPENSVSRKDSSSSRKSSTSSKKESFSSGSFKQISEVSERPELLRRASVPGRYLAQAQKIISTSASFSELLRPDSAFLSLDLNKQSLGEAVSVQKFVLVINPRNIDFSSYLWSHVLYTL